MSWATSYEGDEAEEDVAEEEEDAGQSIAFDGPSRDAVVFLVETLPEMFVKDEEGNCKFTSVIKLTSSFAKKKIINNDKDKVAVVFFPTKKSDNPNGFPSITVFKPLDEPDAQLIKSLEDLAAPGTFEKDVGIGDEHKADFSQAVWVCSTLLGDAGKNSTKRIFIFNYRDDPNLNPSQREKARQKVKDLQDLDITLDLFPMNDAFDPKAFYWDIMQVSEDEDVGTIKEKFSSNFKDLEINLRKKEYKKRALASIPFQIAPDVHIGVKMYCLFRESKPAYPIALDPSTNDQLQCVTKWVCDATGAVLEDHQFKTYYPYADEKVFFTKDEMNTIKDLGPPGLTLMGFKSRRKLKAYHNIKNPYFIYPDDSQIQGSTRAFAALLTQMVKMDKIAIARMIYRRRTVPRFVALLPQDEVIGSDGTQQEFPGFHLIHLPYADDIRNLKLEPTPIAYPDLIVKAKTMITDLRLKFHPEKIFNPKLQRHYAVLQALALDQEAPEETPDMTLPDLDDMEKFAEHIKAFAAASKTEAGDEDDEKGAGRKRKTPAKSNSRTAKPAAASSKRAATGTEAIDFRGMHEAGTLKKLTIPQLKIYCKEHRLGQSGNKEEILRRVADHLDGKASAPKKKK